MKNLYEFPNFKDLINETIFNRIEKAVKEGDGILSFILMACAIDCLASFWHGDSTKGKVGDVYKGFITKYFSNRYSPEDLYTCLRNGVLHMFTINTGKYVLFSNHPEIHLKEITDGMIGLEARAFMIDLISAREAFYKEVEQDPEMMRKFYLRYDRDGFLRQIN